MPFFHGIILRMGTWLRVITGTDLLGNDTVAEEFEGGSYIPAFLQRFFPGEYRVEVRKIHQKKFRRHNSSPVRTWMDNSVSGEVLRFSNSADQYTIRRKGDTGGWLDAFNSIGLIIGNSRKMSKRLIELVRLACAWLYRPVSDPLAIEVIDYDGPETDIDGISAISDEVFFECIDSNKYVDREWRRRMKQNVRNGKTTVVVLRILTPMGEIKGNALVLPKWMMNGYDVRTFQPNIKPEISTTGWYWMTVDPSYGAIPVKSDDLTHSIYRGVEGLYDDDTMLSSLRHMLLQFFSDLKEGKRSEWMEAIADNDSGEIMHEDAFDRFAKNRGLVGRIQLAVAQLASVGVPLTASQTFMFLSVNGLRKQLLGDNKSQEVWMDKDRHWFPVSWAYAAHIMTQEALRVFGFHIPETNLGFYHPDTHCFVVPGDYFAENFENHGGYDLDDTIKVHVRHVVMPDGQTKLMGILLRNPNDFGEWSMIELDSIGPVYHQYGEAPPMVSYNELQSKVPQWTGLKSQLNIGQLPAIANPPQIGDVFSPEDEQRVRACSEQFAAGVGGTVIPKMIWYALNGKPIQNLCAPNEDIIDVLQQGQGSVEDMEIIQKWIDDTMDTLEAEHPTLDCFWWKTRLPEPYKGWRPGSMEDSSWIKLHLARENKVREAIDIMTNWLNANVTMPDILHDIEWTEEELASMDAELRRRNDVFRKNKVGWTDRFVKTLKESDEANGEEYTDRKILLLAYASLKAKERNPKMNHDQWLYTITKHREQPVDWYIRALSRIEQ